MTTAVLIIVIAAVLFAILTLVPETGGPRVWSLTVAVLLLALAVVLPVLVRG